MNDAGNFTSVGPVGRCLLPRAYIITHPPTVLSTAVHGQLLRYAVSGLWHIYTFAVSIRRKSVTATGWQKLVMIDIVILSNLFTELLKTLYCRDKDIEGTRCLPTRVAQQFHIIYNRHMHMNIMCLIIDYKFLTSSMLCFI